MYRIKKSLLNLYRFCQYLFFDELFSFVDKLYFGRRIPVLKISEIDSSKQKILVIAAHSDDEILGMGGSLLMHDALNHEIVVLCVTDGSKSYNENLTKEQMVNTREEEARNLSHFFGHIRHVFMKLPSLEFGLSPILINNIKSFILKEAPDVVYVLSPIDKHPDHTWVGIAALNAINEAGLNSIIRIFEVQVPLTHLLANRYFDVSKYYQTKKHILRTYLSQKIMFHSFDKVLLYNKYLAKNTNGVKAIEAFKELHVSELDGFLKLLEHIKLPDWQIQTITQYRFIYCTYSYMKKYCKENEL